MKGLIDIFFVLRGEHPSLPHAEIKSIFESVDKIHKPRASPPMTYRCRGNVASVKEIARRAYYTRYCLEELWITPDDLDSIYSGFNEMDLTRFDIGERFRISVRSLGGAGMEMDKTELRIKLSEKIKKEYDRSETLINPDTWFMGFFTGDKFIFGRIIEIVERYIADRTPSKRPFIHPSSLQPKLAGCMVNLTRIREGEIFLDPFCGVGGILIEAGRIGCRPVGIDISPWMVEASRENTEHYGLRGDVLMGDARNPPILSFGGVATDPPYGKTTKTLGDTPEEIYADFMGTFHDLLGKDRYLCLAAPDSIGVADVGVEVGFKHVESHFIQVHSNLNREIALFMR
jgi:tRNA (guanine10-N2)-dimethyltransferase